MKQPQTVTISVITYNSSKYVLETLESIRNQTYPKLVLHICDDFSTDNTIELCKEWIEQNKDRFESTDIIVPNHNTGVSANCNRAWDFCTTTYNKDIAGDDILLPNCIEDNMKYVEEHPEAVIIFGKMIGFGSSKEEVQEVMSRFDYSFFDLTSEEQYYKLIYTENCLPAPAAFCNLYQINKISFRHDERIRDLEDWPKWIKLLKLGIKFHFLSKDVVKYRVDSGISTQIMSVNYYHTAVLMKLLYCYPEWLKADEQSAVERLSEEMTTLYGDLRKARMELDHLRNTHAYKLGRALLKPIKFLLK